MIPTLPVLDSGPALLGDGYRYLSRAADRAGSDAFWTRILGRRALCLRGAEAARFFYEGGRFDRTGAMPPTALRLLQDRGSVQTLEGREHEIRKAGFWSLLQDSLGRLEGIATERFSLAIRRWRASRTVALDEQLPWLFTEIAMRWTGIPPERAQIGDRAPELWAMITEAGAFGPSNWATQLRRERTEAWARLLIEDVRAGRERAVVGTPLAAVAGWTDGDGALLPTRVAAVELLNLVRPIVAVALYAEFAALALLLKPELAERIRDADVVPADRRGLATERVDDFVHEVRRRTPFFPLIAGRATRDLDWHGDAVPAGTWALLDLYGTNHDPRLWPRPQAFDPDRYRRGDGDARHIVSQGFGDYVADHRCPGEPATEVLLGAWVQAITSARVHAATDQSGDVTWGRMPARVSGGLRITVT